MGYEDEYDHDDVGEDDDVRLQEASASPLTAGGARPGSHWTAHRSEDLVDGARHRPPPSPLRASSDPNCSLALLSSPQAQLTHTHGSSLHPGQKTDQRCLGEDASDTS